MTRPPRAGAPTPTALLAAASARLAQAGVDSPRADADWLLAHALRVDRGRLLLVDEVGEHAAERFERAVRRRAAREPLQHILGRVEFGVAESVVGLRVGPGVFVPRPETELLLEWAVAAAPRGALVADFCSGSGALALGLAAARDDVRVVAVELFDRAREWLRANVAAQPLLVAQRVAVVAADVTARSDAGPRPARWDGRWAPQSTSSLRTRPMCRRSPAVPRPRCPRRWRPIRPRRCSPEPMAWR